MPKEEKEKIICSCGYGAFYLGYRWVTRKVEKDQGGDGIARRGVECPMCGRDPLEPRAGRMEALARELD